MSSAIRSYTRNDSSVLDLIIEDNMKIKTEPDEASGWYDEENISEVNLELLIPDVKI